MADSPHISPQKPLGRVQASGSTECAGGQCAAQAELALSTLLLAFSSSTQSQPRKLLWMGWKILGTHLFMRAEDFCTPLKVYVLKMWRDPPFLTRRGSSWEGTGVGIQKMWQVYPDPEAYVTVVSLRRQKTTSGLNHSNHTIPLGSESETLKPPEWD